MWTPYEGVGSGVADPTDSVPAAPATDGVDFTPLDALHVPTSTPNDTAHPATNFAVRPTVAVTSVLDCLPRDG